jgi:hypothetical protein
MVPSLRVNRTNRWFKEAASGIKSAIPAGGGDWTFSDFEFSTGSVVEAAKEVAVVRIAERKMQTGIQIRSLRPIGSKRVESNFMISAAILPEKFMVFSVSLDVEKNRSSE